MPRNTERDTAIQNLLQVADKILDTKSEKPLTDENMRLLVQAIVDAKKETIKSHECGFFSKIGITKSRLASQLSLCLTNLANLECVDKKTIQGYIKVANNQDKKETPQQKTQKALKNF